MPDFSWMNAGPDKPPSNDWMSAGTPVPHSGSVVDVGGVRQQDDQRDFDFVTKFNQDNRLLRAQNQGFGEQLVKTLGNTVSNMATGVVEGFGYLPELFDSSHDYSNAITRTMQEWKNPFGEVYREQPNQTWDIGDPAWWLGNFQSLAESAGAFAAEGIGLAKVFGTIAKGAGTLMNLGKTGKAVATGAAELASATTLAYTEGAMSGYRIYEQAYQQNYLKGIRAGLSIDEANEEAKQVAAHAAATTVRINTMMNTVLNLGSLAPLFKEPTDEVLHWMKTAGKRQEGESIAAWKNRLKEAAADSPELKKVLANRKGYSSMLAEMGKEGVEEVNTQYAEAEGQRVADGKSRDLFSALTDLDQYFSDVTDEEGALNFVLGSIGGAAQTALIDHIPSKRIVKYDANNNPIYKQGEDGKLVTGKDGKPRMETQLVTPRAYNEFGSRQYFENIRDAVVADIDRMEKLQTDLLSAHAKGNKSEVERLKGELFNVRTLDAINKGLGASWEKLYEEIGAADNQTTLGSQLQPQIDAIDQQIQQSTSANDAEAVAELTEQRKSLVAQQIKLQDVTEAMQKGYAKDMNDNEYKEHAREAVRDIKHLTELHSSIQKQYYDAATPATGELADHLFFRHADLYTRKRGIDRETARIEKIEQLQGTGINTSTDLFNNQVQKYKENMEVLNSTLKELQKDSEAIVAADKKGDLAVLKSMIAKYRAKGTDDQDMAGTINDLARKLELKARQYQTASAEAKRMLEEGTGFTEWLKGNDGKSFDDYTKGIAHNVLLTNDKAHLESAKVQYDIAEQNLREMTDGKGINQILVSFASQKDKVIKAINERNRKDNIDNFLRQQSKEAAARIPVKEKAALAARLQQEEANLTQQLNEARDKMTELQIEQKNILAKGMGLFRNLDKVIPIREKISTQKMVIRSLEAKLNTVKDQLATLEVKQAVAEHKQAEVQSKTNEELRQAETELEDEDKYHEEDPYAGNGTEGDQNSDTEKDLEFSGEPEADPVGKYMSLKNELPQPALLILDRMEQEFTGKEMSYQRFHNAFSPMIKLGKLDLDQVNKAFFALRDYLAAKEKPVIPQPDLEVKPVPAAEEVRVDDIPAVVELGQPEIFINAAMFTEQGLEEFYWEQGAKTTDAVKANAADLQYRTIVDPTNGKLMLRNETGTDFGPLLDEKSNKARMVPGAIDIGDDVTLQIDTEYAGTVRNTDSLEQDEYLKDEELADSFANYIDADGKIRMKESHAAVGYGNVPIKIVHSSTGSVIGYLPRINWINETKGASTHRNVEDVKGFDENGDPIYGNVAEQEARVLKIRKRLAELHNQQPGALLHTKVSNRTEGRMMYMGDLKNDGRVKMISRLSANALPDSSLNFAVITREGIMIGKGVPASTKFELAPLTDMQMDKMKGAPVVLIPLPNGQYKPVPLQTTQFKDRKADLHTVERAIELYLQKALKKLDPKGEKLIADIARHTGFDIGSEDGLRNFINQYFTLTSNFADATVKADAQAISGEGKVQKFKLAIPARGGKALHTAIKVGVTFSGNDAVYAKLGRDGKLTPEFRGALKSGLSERFKNVTFEDGVIKGMNNNSPITTVIIREDDVLSTKHFNSYNDYLKSFTYTNVYGKHKVGDTYVYAANSQVILDSKMLEGSDNSVRELEVDDDTDPTSAGEMVDMDDDLSILDDLTNGAYVYQPQKARLVIQPEGVILNLSNLQDLYKFTPESQRNGTFPHEALEKLQKLGINRIADGYNPFLKCN